MLGLFKPMHPETLPLFYTLSGDSWRRSLWGARARHQKQARLDRLAAQVQTEEKRRGLLQSQSSEK